MRKFYPETFPISHLQKLLSNKSLFVWNFLPIKAVSFGDSLCKTVSCPTILKTPMVTVFVAKNWKQNPILLSKSSSVIDLNHLICRSLLTVIARYLIFSLRFFTGSWVICPNDFFLWTSNIKYYYFWTVFFIFSWHSNFQTTCHKNLIYSFWTSPLELFPHF